MIFNLRILLKCQFCFTLGENLKVYISNKLSGDSDAVVLRPQLEHLGNFHAHWHKLTSLVKIRIKKITLRKPLKGTSSLRKISKCVLMEKTVWRVPDTFNNNKETGDELWQAILPYFPPFSRPLPSQQDSPSICPRYSPALWQNWLWLRSSDLIL